jgi:hypothetical protein
VTFTGRPKEGKLQLEAAWDGLFKVKVEPLVRFNLLQEMMCATIHTYTPVKAGQRLAGTRIIPLIIHRSTLEEARRVNTAMGKYKSYNTRKYCLRFF